MLMVRLAWPWPDQFFQNLYVITRLEQLHMHQIQRFALIMAQQPAAADHIIGSCKSDIAIANDFVNKNERRFHEFS